MLESRVEQLRHGHEGDDLVLLEGLHAERAKSSEGAAKAIDFIDDYAIDLAGLDVGLEAVEQGGPVHVAAGEAAIVSQRVGQEGQPSPAWLRT